MPKYKPRPFSILPLIGPLSIIIVPALADDGVVLVSSALKRFVIMSNPIQHTRITENTIEIVDLLSVFICIALLLLRVR